MEIKELDKEEEKEEEKAASKHSSGKKMEGGLFEKSEDGKK